MPDRKQRLIQEIERVDAQPPGSGLAKHRKMASSPFVFLRGSAQLFYADLASGDLQLPDALYDLPLTPIMGDCHVSNFGFLTEEGSHGDRVIFAANDFDDACYGHAIWDLARFALSLLLCAEHCRGLVAGRYPGNADMRGQTAVSEPQAIKAVETFFQAYADTCARHARTRKHHEQVFDRFNRGHILSRPYKKARKRAFGGADFMHKSSLAKAVDLNRRPHRFRSLPERFKRLSANAYRELLHQFEPYMDDSVLDIVQRIGAGTGSNNMRRYYFLIGPREVRKQRDLFLCHLVEVKQQREAAPIHHFPELSPQNRLDTARLSVVCQRRMQRSPDLLLSESTWQDAHWLIRSRHHARVGIDPEHIGIGKRAVAKGGFEQYADVCGRVLALTHARGDRRSTLLEQRIHKRLPRLTAELIHSLQAYAREVQADCHRLAELEGQGKTGTT